MHPREVLGDKGLNLWGGEVVLANVDGHGLFCVAWFGEEAAP